MSTELGLESSFLNSSLHRLAFKYLMVSNYTIPLSKEDPLVCPVFLTPDISYIPRRQSIYPFVPLASFVTECSQPFLWLLFPPDRRLLSVLSRQECCEELVAIRYPGLGCCGAGNISVLGRPTLSTGLGTQGLFVGWINWQKFYKAIYCL